MAFVIGQLPIVTLCQGPYTYSPLNNRLTATNQPRFTSVAVFGVYPPVALAGDRVNILGRNFPVGSNPGVLVGLGAAPLTVVALSPRVITLQLPIAAGGGEVTVSVPDPQAPGGRRTFSAGTLRVLSGDADGDCIPHAWELALGLDPGRADSDADGVRDGDEDADGDGVTNCEELTRAMDPLDRDTDGDELADADELARGTDPLQADSDLDGFIDGEEVRSGSDPSDPLKLPIDLTRLGGDVTAAGFAVLNVALPGTLGPQEASGVIFSVLDTALPLVSGPQEASGVIFSVLSGSDPTGPPLGEAIGPAFSVHAAAAVLKRGAPLDVKK